MSDYDEISNHATKKLHDLIFFYWLGGCTIFLSAEHCVTNEICLDLSISSFAETLALHIDVVKMRFVFGGRICFYQNFVKKLK